MRTNQIMKMIASNKKAIICAIGMVGTGILTRVVYGKVFGADQDEIVDFEEDYDPSYDEEDTQEETEPMND